MISMSAQRAFRSALARADRQKEYSIDFDEITPKILEEIRILLSSPEEDLVSYAEDFTERLDEKRRAEVVRDILDKLQNILDNALIIELGKLGVEGPNSAPTKTMREMYDMENKSLEGWFSENAQDLYDRFVRQEFRPLLNTYVFFEKQGLLAEYASIISSVNRTEEESKLLEPTGDIDDERQEQIRKVLGVEQSQPKKNYLFNELLASDLRGEMLSSGDNLQNLLELIISSNDITNSTSKPIVELEQFAIIPLTTFVRRLFAQSSRKTGIQFLNLYANLISRRGETETEGRFRLGAGDLVPTGRMLRDFYDYEKPDEPYQEWVRDKDTEGFGNRLEAFMARPKSKRMSRALRASGDRELLAYYRASARRGFTPNFEVGVSPEKTLSSLVGFIRLFDENYELNVLPLSEIETDEQQDKVETDLNTELVKGITALRKGMVREFNSVLRLMYERPTISFKSVGGKPALEFLEELDILEDDTNV